MKKSTCFLTGVLVSIASLTIARAQCPQYTANAKEKYRECVTGANFDCLGACGPGCSTCRVEVFAIDCGPAGTSCSGRQFQCYERDCCRVHDAALNRADRLPNGAARLASRINAHISAARNGCGRGDFLGKTFGKSDARCLNFDDLCLED